SKRRTAPAARSSSSDGGQETKVTRLTRELNEALEQQKAAAEVLKIISTSPTELQPVLDVVVRSAARFCSADDVTIFELDGQALHIAAHWGAVLSQEIGVRFPCTRGSVAGRTVIDRKPVHVIDLQAEADEFPEGYAFAKRLGQRTTAGVPLLREGVAIGTIQIRRTEVNPFTDKQIALLGTFAAQAVIAIENARLLNELRQRTTDLTESLEQQTATAEVLRVISSSPGNLEPVFQAMLTNPTCICGAEFGMLWLAEGDGFRPVALHGVPPALAEMRQPEKVFYVDPETPLRRLAQTKQLEHIADATREPAYTKGLQPFKEFVDVFGARTFVMVPMLKGAAPLGAMAIYRKEVRLFTDKQIALVRNFAAQAVIAIENARLLSELRQRTTDLSESLEQQTAASQVLSIISSSPAELETVFQAILENATRLCGAKFAGLSLYDGEAFRYAADYNVPSEYADMRLRERLYRPHPRSGVAEMTRTKQPVQINDLRTSPPYLEGDPALRAIVHMGGARTMILIPMLKDEKLIGVVAIYRQEVHPFTDKQIALVQNFAAQAVIAIENARLLNELRESLQQQTATADVLKLISRSTFDLKSVLDTLVQSAARLCEAEHNVIFLRDDNVYRIAARHGLTPELEEYTRQHPISPGRNSV